jgi:hypothetical protein
MSKIFVRHRRRVGKGDKRPRYAVVAVEGEDIRFSKVRMRRVELEKIAEEIGAEIVYLPRGESEEKPEEETSRGHRRY